MTIEFGHIYPVKKKNIVLKSTSFALFQTYLYYNEWIYKIKWLQQLNHEMYIIYDFFNLLKIYF